MLPLRRSSLLTACEESTKEKSRVCVRACVRLRKLRKEEPALNSTKKRKGGGGENLEGSS